MAANPHTGPELIGATHVAAPKKSHLGFIVLVVVVAGALAAGIAYELSQRKTQQETLASGVADAAKAGPPTTSVGHVRSAPSEAAIEIPGQTVAQVDTPIYTRTDGYLKVRNVEVGQRVKKGDLLMELDTPDLDQQIEQAKATLAQSKAFLAQLQANLQSAISNQKLAKVTADRTKSLVAQGVMAPQDYDNKLAALEAGDASVNAAQEAIKAQQSTITANEASLNRLVEQKKYARMEAPFDGIVTFRNQQASEIGTLISAGSAKEILHVSQIQTLRIFVNVPQNYAPIIKAGQTADLLLDEFPGRVFPAKVDTTTNAVDPTSRSMLTILSLDNSKGELLPGMYAKVRFKLPHRVNVLRLPADALILRTEGPQVAVLDETRKVHIVPVTLGRDYGAEIEVNSGLSNGDTVVLSPTDAIREGVTVNPKERGK